MKLIEKKVTYKIDKDELIAEIVKYLNNNLKLSKKLENKDFNLDFNDEMGLYELTVVDDCEKTVLNEISEQYHSIIDYGTGDLDFTNRLLYDLFGFTEGSASICYFNNFSDKGYYYITCDAKDKGAIPEKYL